MANVDRSGGTQSDETEAVGLGTIACKREHLYSGFVRTNDSERGTQVVRQDLKARLHNSPLPT